MKAIVLLSGGLDCTVLLAYTLKLRRDVYALTFDYGQRQKAELNAAKAIAAYYKIPHRIIKIDPLIFDTSELIPRGPIEKYQVPPSSSKLSIPATYIPARNTIFISYALAQAEQLAAEEIYFGPIVSDYEPYPDSRPEYVSAFQGLINVATKQSLVWHPPKLIAPFIRMTKAEVIKKGIELNAPLDLSWSCYDPTAEGKACEECLACVLRSQGFQEANIN